jgi:hypothetical protein
MGQSSAQRLQRRRARKERKRALSQPKERLGAGRDLFISIEEVISKVAKRHGGIEPPVIAQALCLVTSNLALREGIPKERLQEIMGIYMDQAAELLKEQQQREQGELSPGGLILPG